MGAKVHYMGKSEAVLGVLPSEDLYAFHCPGCEYGHHITVPRWKWNGSLDRPTVTPSLLVNSHDPTTRCHSFVTDGNIEFQADCHHALAGKTVELPDWDE